MIVYGSQIVMFNLIPKMKGQQLLQGRLPQDIERREQATVFMDALRLMCRICYNPIGRESHMTNPNINEKSGTPLKEVYHMGGSIF